MHISEYLNLSKLSSLISNGYIEKKISPCGNFYLLDYTRQTTFDSMWCVETIRCRGLVVDANDDTIVGMCIPKFHNLTEGAAHHLKAYKECIDNKMSFTVTEKMDGSFGNVWWDKYQQKWRCSTRGSFESDQANWANEWLYKNRDKLFIYFPEDDGKMSTHQNLIVEIIYPDNRVVVDYGTRSGLILLTSFFHKRDGSIIEDKPDSYALYGGTIFGGFPIVPTHRFNSIDEIVAKCETLDGNHEGYVLRFENNFRVKVKGKEYCRLHKILSGLSTKAVWENLDLENWCIRKEWLIAVPEEFREEVEEYGKKLLDEIHEELTMIDEGYMLSVQIATDKFGSCFTKKEYVCEVLPAFPKKLFNKILLAYGGKVDELKEQIWKEHQPEFKKMTIVGEDE